MPPARLSCSSSNESLPGSAQPAVQAPPAHHTCHARAPLPALLPQLPLQPQPQPAQPLPEHLHPRPHPATMHLGPLLQPCPFWRLLPACLPTWLPTWPLRGSAGAVACCWNSDGRPGALTLQAEWQALQEGALLQRDDSPGSGSAGSMPGALPNSGSRLREMTAPLTLRLRPCPTMTKLQPHLIQTPACQQSGRSCAEMAVACAWALQQVQVEAQYHLHTGFGSERGQLLPTVLPTVPPL